MMTVIFLEQYLQVYFESTGIIIKYKKTLYDITNAEHWYKTISQYYIIISAVSAVNVILLISPYMSTTSRHWVWAH